ncbi:MAG: PD-(D/E)XK nuclease family protein, partial [Candidatus Cloacimonetes bacterium]|nr:PD-(D/E)XK nuclease family protein [Candidatus Cloacimonadota bacterium]
QITLNLLNSIVWEGKPFVISIQQVLNATLSDEFLSCFGQEKTRREQIRTFLFELIENDFQYLDLEYFLQNENEFKNEFEQLFKFLQKTQNIKSIKTLIEFINTEIDIEKLVAEESRKTDIIKVFYELLADFASIEDIGIIPDWRSIFSGSITTNILQLFLDYMKSKQTRYELDEVAENRIQITSLQDSRNLNFENVYVLNVIEGILPAAKHAQFLLSENQRSKLGLKTYEDIKLRDKYYFYRLLACCDNAIVFTRSHLEENIEVSSFIEELKLYDLVEETDKSAEKNNLYEQTFSSLLKKNESPLPNVDKISSDFFTIPHEKNDFPDKKLALSFYKWDKLKKNPFEYYIEHIAGLKARNPQVLNDFSSKLIGTISHSIFALIWNRLIEIYQGNTIHHNFMYNTKNYVEQAVEHFLKYNKKLKYLSPHNYSENYFRNIFIPILKDGIANFFYRLHNDLQFTDKSISIFPETGKVTQKRFFNLDEIEISLRGRPDLRIHTSDDELYIFDYKTGSSNTKKVKKYNEQLQFYEFINYLIESPEFKNELNSYLFFIEEKNLSKLTKPINLKEAITEVIQSILENGFSLAGSKDDYEDIEITRRDLKMKMDLMK